MKCSKVRRFLNPYIDKELDNKKVIALIEEHLNICPYCKAELNSLNLMKGLIAQKEKVTVEESFLVRLKNKLRGEPQIIRLKWLPEAGDLARRLIPVPVAIMILIFTLIFAQMNMTFSPVDEYIFEDLTNEEMGILSGYIDNSDLLAEVVFEEVK